jgi:DNA mismatch endonuclease, patch repair protein
VRGLPGTPDVAIQKYRLAIQIRGCFWHSHECKHSSIPKTNRDYCVPKLKRNIERDLASDQKLRALGFKLFVLWECEIKTKQILDRKITTIIHYIESERDRLTGQL